MDAKEQAQSLLRRFWPFGRKPKKKLPQTPGVEVLSKRAVLYGVALFALLVAFAFFWRLATSEGALEKLKLFEFSVREPVTEEFELSDPVRDILQEQPEDLPTDVAMEERPNIQMAVVPTEVKVTEELVQTANIEVETPEINLESTEIDIDAPEEISEASEVITYAVNPIAADAPGPADIFKYKQPSPRNKPLLYMLNRAPRPSRTMRALPKTFGDQEAPAMGELGPANLNLFGTGDFFRTMTRFGGMRAKSAVDAALHWLAVHQEPNGIWDAEKYEGGKNANPAVTGLAVMALMGGGNTVRKGEYRRNVLRGVEALMRLQKDNGAVDENMYCHSMATIALCEAYGRARDERVGKAARKAADYCEKRINPDGGWRYTPSNVISDMSVTGWVMMALKTAKLAQIKFDHKVYSQGLSFIDSVTDRGGSRDSNGVVTYQYSPDQQYDSNSRPAMTTAGMMIRQFSGVGVKSHLLVKGAELTKDIPPNWGQKDFYLWYYATYAMHNMGGEYRIWWNRRIRDVLLANQSKEGDNAGSWDPKGDRWARSGGRVYTTALGALCLEVYYRYSEALNSFGVAPDLDDLFLQ